MPWPSASRHAFLLEPHRRRLPHQVHAQPPPMPHAHGRKGPQPQCPQTHPPWTGTCSSRNRLPTRFVLGRTSARHEPLAVQAHPHRHHPRHRQPPTPLRPGQPGHQAQTLQPARCSSPTPAGDPRVPGSPTMSVVVPVPPVPTALCCRPAKDPTQRSKSS